VKYAQTLATGWHKDADASAAWELIHGLKSTDQATRVVVSALLNKRKTAREIGVAQVRRIPLRQGAGREHSIWIGNHRELSDVQIAQRQMVLLLLSAMLKSFSTASHLSTYPGAPCSLSKVRCRVAP